MGEIVLQAQTDKREWRLPLRIVRPLSEQAEVSEEAMTEVEEDVREQDRLRGVL